MGGTTLKDIAKKIGVSTTTVSIILNNKAPHISNETKELVKRTAQEMNYRPNSIARSLVNKSTHTIGLIIPDIANPFFAEITKGVCQEAMKSNYTVSIFNTDDDVNKDSEYLDYMQNICVDGIIAILGTDGQEKGKEHRLHKLKNCSCPILLIDRLIDGDFISVTTDNKQGAFLATEHLVKLGHTKIGCISGPLNTSFSKERFYGYLEALQKHSIKFNSELLYEGDYRCDAGYKGAEYLLKKDITAIFAFNDMIAYGVYKLLKEYNLKVPDDISVVGYDDLLYSSMISTPLTTVNQPAYQMGQKSAEKLIKFIHGELSKDEYNTKFIPELIVRESSIKNNKFI